MWKISIVQGLMQNPNSGEVFDLGITDITKFKDVIKAGKKFFREKKKEWSYAHAPKIFFELEIDTENWVTKKEKKDAYSVIQSISDIDIP